MSMIIVECILAGTAKMNIRPAFCIFFDQISILSACGVTIYVPLPFIRACVYIVHVYNNIII